MRVYHFLLGFLTLLFATSGFSQADSRMALIRPIRGAELLPPVITRQLDRLNIQVVARQKNLQIILSGDDIPTSSVMEIVAIEGEVVQTASGYRVEARLLDLKKKTLISKASRDEIREEDLIRLYQGALEALFLPPDAPLDKFSDPPATTPPPVLPKPKKNPPSTTQLNAPDPQTIDFKERVRGLKMDVDKQVAKNAELIEKKIAAEEKKALVAEEAKRRNSEQTLQEKFPEAKFGKAFDRKYVLSFGFEKRSLYSQDLIETQTDLSLLTAKVVGHNPFSVLAGRLGWTYELAASKTVSTPLPIPTPYKVGLGASWFESWWSAHLGLFRDVSSFINASTPGGGKQVSMISSTWIRASAQTTLKVARLPWKLDLGVGLPYQVSSGQPSLKDASSWSGTFFQFSLTPPLVVKNFESHIMYERSNLSTQGVRPFTLNESRYGFFISYSL